MRDWTGNKRSAYATLGASNHSGGEREIDDYYATDPKALEVFLDKIDEDGIRLHKNIWECACGEGHLSEVLKSRGYSVKSTDIIDRGYSETSPVDFLKTNSYIYKGDILTNPPYKYAKEFVEKAMEVTRIGAYTVMFLKIQFLEGQGRKELFKKYPPKYVYVNSKRQVCAKNGDFNKYANGTGTAICYCWFVWEKGFIGEPVIRWI